MVRRPCRRSPAVSSEGEARMRAIGVYGASGFGLEVMPLVRAQHKDADVEFFFVDDGKADGEAVLSFENFVGLPHQEKMAVIAIANSAIREKLDVRCQEAGVNLIDVRAANSVSLDDVEVGPGAILCGF